MLFRSLVTVSQTAKRGITDVLTFNDDSERYTGLKNFPLASIPTVQVVKVQNLVILKSADRVITLPAPEFGDTEAGTGRLNIKRSMDGGRVVYVRDNVVQKLNYQFIFDRRKAIELREFILNCNTKPLTMINWKGEIWAVQMTNSP